MSLRNSLAWSGLSKLIIFDDVVADEIYWRTYFRTGFPVHELILKLFTATRGGPMEWRIGSESPDVHALLWQMFAKSFFASLPQKISVAKGAEPQYG
jgi:hypothetical protein